jgi:conjugal transfer ATP-binding protein TraC
MPQGITLPEPEAANTPEKKGLLNVFGQHSQPKQSSGQSEAERLYQQGIATIRDLIAPPAIKLKPNSMQVGDVLARTYFVIAYPRYLSTNWFSPIINIDFAMDTALFVHPIDTAEILKNLRKSATQVQSQIHIEAENGKIRNPQLETALEDIEALRDKLMQGTEKFFRFGLYMTIYGTDDRDLNDKCQTVESILEAQLVYVKPAVLRMDQGFAATRPIATDTLDVANNLNTEPLSTTFPFVSSDLSSNDGILYGINRHNNSLVLFDRFKLENANMVVFAKSGAGKSYTVKLEVLRSMMFGTDVIIIDPENEYGHLCEAVGGTFLKISLGSNVHLNPFDLPKSSSDDGNEGVLRNTIANIIGLLHIMLGAVTPEEDSILDRAIHETYAIRDITERTDYAKLTPAAFPTMSDLYAVLENMDGAESLTARLERYTEGIFGGFLNKQTNIDMENQLVVFNIRDLEEELRPIAMYIVLQFIWNEVRSKMKRRVVVVDEAWVMMQHEDAASFLFGIAKRCRKYYTGLTTITQDISDFMNSRYGKPIITNSSLQLLLRQSPSSIDLIAETFYLTDHEKFLLLESNVGEGIFFAGSKHAAIKVIASYSEDQIITSDPRQLLEIETAKQEFGTGQ